MVYHEFKELLLELAIRLKDQIDSAPGKLRSLVKKFLDDLFLKRLKPYIKSISSKTKTASAGPETAAAVRTWPESEKDKIIKAAQEEKAKQAAEAERIAEEQRLKQAE